MIAVRLAVVVVCFAAVACSDNSEHDPNGEREALVNARYQPLTVTATLSVPSVTRILDLEVADEDGREIAWLLSDDANPVTRVNLHDSTITKYGSRGRGPGDILFPSNFSRSASYGSAPPVFDLGNLKLVGYSDGEHNDRPLRDLIGSSVVLAERRQLSTAKPKHLLELGGQVVWLAPSGPVMKDRDLWPAKVMASPLGLPRENATMLAEFSPPPEFRESLAEDVFVPFPMLARCNDSTAVVYLNEPDQLYWITGGLIRLGAQGMGSPRPAIDQRDRLAWLQALVEVERRDAGVSLPSGDSLKAMVEAAELQFRGGFAAFGPRATELLCSPDENVLLFEFSTRYDNRGLSNKAVLLSRFGDRSLLEFPGYFVPRRMTGVSVWGTTDTAPSGPQVVQVRLP